MHKQSDKWGDSGSFHRSLGMVATPHDVYTRPPVQPGMEEHYIPVNQW